MLVRPDDQAVGHEQRVEERPHAARPRPLDLVGALSAQRRLHRQREPGPHDPDLGGVERVRLPFLAVLLPPSLVLLSLPRPLARSFCTKTFSGHNDWVRSVLPSSDGLQLISCSVDQVRPLPLARRPSRLGLSDSCSRYLRARRRHECGRRRGARPRPSCEGTSTSSRSPSLRRRRLTRRYERWRASRCVSFLTSSCAQ